VGDPNHLKAAFKVEGVRLNVHANGDQSLPEIPETALQPGETQPRIGVRGIGPEGVSVLGDSSVKQAQLLGRLSRQVSRESVVWPELNPGLQRFKSFRGLALGEENFAIQHISKRRIQLLGQFASSVQATFFDPQIRLHHVERGGWLLN
jgi:hypothetical protein